MRRNPFHARALAFLALLLVAPSTAAAGDPHDPAVAILCDYKKVEKSHDPAVCRQRRLLVGRIAAIGGPKALHALRAIAAADAEILVRVAALEGLVHAGGPDEVDAAIDGLRTESRRYKWVPLWVARAFEDAASTAAGPWLASKLSGEGTSDIALAMVRGLGALRARDAVPSLLKALERHDGDDEREVRFRFEVLRALGRIGGPPASECVLQATASPDLRLRLAAADTLLATDGGAPHVDAMVRLLADPEPAVRRAAARAVGAFKAQALKGVLIERLTDPRRCVADAAHGALVALEGSDRGPRPESWLPKGATYAPVGPVDVDRTRLPTDRALFLMDMSLSMDWPIPPAKPRISLARERMCDLLRRLDERTCFNVREFASESSTWKKVPGKLPGELPATARNVADAVAWLGRVKTHMYTHFDEILEAMEDHPAVETMYLVTDGRIQFDADDVSERLLVRLEAANLFRRVPVHVTFVWWGPSKMPSLEGSSADQRPLLAALASESGGTYTELLEAPH